MNAKTRYLVVTSLLVLTIGLGAGLVAYYSGFATSAFTSPAGPDELKFVPADATLVAYADVHEIMTSGLRQKLQAAMPGKEDGRRQFAEHTGINIETDIDHLVAFAAPRSSAGHFPGSMMVVARGRFDVVKIEGLMREHGAQVEEYKGKRLLVSAPQGDRPALSVGFLEPGLVAVGETGLVHGAVDLRDGGASVLTNDTIMDLVHTLNAGNAWAVGRFDALAARATLPDGVREKLPPITWFSASARVDDTLSASLRAEATDDQAANDLREVIRGGMALAKLQLGSRPEMQGLVQSFQLGGTGKTVSLSFDLPVQLFDALATFAGQHRQERLIPDQRPR